MQTLSFFPLMEFFEFACLPTARGGRHYSFHNILLRQRAQVNEVKGTVLNRVRNLETLGL